MAKISVTRALAQIKSLTARIQSDRALPFITYSVGGKHPSGTNLDDMKQKLQSNLQSVRDMIALRATLKRAVVQSNSVTLVTIGGEEMTVAQAIERKSSIELEKGLLQNLVQQQMQVHRNVETVNVDVQKRLEALLQTTVGKDRKIDDAEIKAISDPFRASNEAAAVDPNNLLKVIEQLQDELNTFLLEVDYALSEVNATTTIEVEV